jgi:hypothetical protein
MDSCLLALELIRSLPEPFPSLSKSLDTKSTQPPFAKIQFKAERANIDGVARSFLISQRVECAALRRVLNAFAHAPETAHYQIMRLGVAGWK